MLDELSFLGASLLFQILAIGFFVGFALGVSFFANRLWPSRPNFVREYENVALLGAIVAVLIFVF